MAVGRWGLRTDKFKHQSSRVYLGGALKPSQMDDELNQDPLNQPQAHLLCPPDNIHMMNVPHFVVVVVLLLLLLPLPCVIVNTNQKWVGLATRL